MRFPSKLRFALQFAHFCDRMSIKPGDLALMIYHARASAFAYAQNNNQQHRKHQDEFEKVASRCGLEVDWPGLWPCIQKKDDPQTNTLLPSYE